MPHHCMSSICEIFHVCVTMLPAKRRELEAIKNKYKGLNFISVDKAPDVFKVEAIDEKMKWLP